MAGRALAGSAQSVASGGRNSWPCERTGPPLSRLLPGGAGQKAAARLLEALRAAAGRGGRSTAGRNTANEARTRSDGWMWCVRHTAFPPGRGKTPFSAGREQSPAPLHKGFCLPWGYSRIPSVRSFPWPCKASIACSVAGSRERRRPLVPKPVTGRLNEAGLRSLRAELLCLLPNPLQ